MFFPPILDTDAFHVSRKTKILRLAYSLNTCNERPATRSLVGRKLVTCEVFLLWRSIFRFVPCVVWVLPVFLQHWVEVPIVTSLSGDREWIQ